jgi:hypothetical protein
MRPIDFFGGHPERSEGPLTGFLDTLISSDVMSFDCEVPRSTRDDTIFDRRLISRCVSFELLRKLRRNVGDDYGVAPVITQLQHMPDSMDLRD